MIGMKIEKENGRHYIQDDSGKSIGEITYSENDANTITIEHTYVNENHRGEGVARKLVDSIVQEMKLEDKKIIPACKYAAAIFERVPSYKEQLAQQ